jgi:Mrp family chromosome partitioning ATPase
VKPDLTFRRSLRMIAKRWWLLAICGLLVGGAAFFVVHSKKAKYQAAVNITVKDFAVSPKLGTPSYVIVPANPNFPDQWVPSDFITQQAAATTSRNLGGSPSASEIINSLLMTGLTNTKVELQYTSPASAAEALSVLHQYTTVLISQRVNATQTAIATAVSNLNQLAQRLNCNEQCPQARKILRNATTLTALQSTIPGDYSSGFDSSQVQPQATAIPPGGPPALLAGAGGFVAGLAVGALLALLWGRADSRVRRPEDIEVASVPVVDVDSASDSASIQLLRSELELAGVGTRLGVLAVTRATRAEGSSGLALALARAFAGVGTPTVLVSADLRERSVRPEAGLSEMLDSSSTEPPLVPLTQNLRWLPEGSSNAHPETLFSAPRVDRIVRALRGQAAVVIIDAPAVLEDAETLPLIASSDIVLLTVRPGSTEWTPLGGAVTLIQRIAKRPLHICYDRAPERSSVPVSERSGVAERVHQAIEVPAG